MLVVADTSPLNYLILVDAVDVLVRMYGRVVVPAAVARELSAEGAPAKTRGWFARRPGWLEVRVAAAPSDFRDSMPARRRRLAWPRNCVRTCC